MVLYQKVEFFLLYYLLLGQKSTIFFGMGKEYKSDGCCVQVCWGFFGEILSAVLQSLGKLSICSVTAERMCSGPFITSLFITKEI